VYLYGEKDWEKIAEFVPQRSVAQCRERYKSSLNPNLRPPHVWTYEEDRRMLIITEQLKKEGMYFIKFISNMKSISI
jgi:hypothetical protein